MERTRCSTATKSSPMETCGWRAASTSASRWRPRTCLRAAAHLGLPRAMKRSMNPTAAEGSAPASVKMRSAKESFCSKSALHKCSVSTICCCALEAISGARTIASHARSVNSFWEIFSGPPRAPRRSHVAVARRRRVAAARPEETLRSPGATRERGRGRASVRRERRPSSSTPSPSMTSCAERCVDPFVPAPRSACAVECADIVRRRGGRSSRERESIELLPDF